jgi:glycosyltransferase involved in cell wall biosynthesis
MRVCLIATELRGFGTYGGFGVLTYNIAAGLASRGVETYVAMRRQKGQKPVETIDGITVVSYPTPRFHGLSAALPYAGVYRMIDADVYHSQESSLGTCLAQRAEPGKKHIVTFQGVRSLESRRIHRGPRTVSLFSVWKSELQYLFTTGRAARKADAHYCQAKFMIDRVAALYRLGKKPGFLPNPVNFTEIRQPKASQPTVCFVGRWNTIKRPELFLDLAGKFPHVTFILTGAYPDSPEKDQALRQRCRELKNVEAPGWISGAVLDAVLDRSWVLINTSIEECLPVSYLEAGSHKCAILSHGNADDFASGFGFWAEQGDVEDYARGLGFLLEENRWQALGEKACAYVRATHEYNRVIDQHIGVYKQLLQGGENILTGPAERSNLPVADAPMVGGTR